MSDNNSEDDSGPSEDAESCYERGLSYGKKDKEEKAIASFTNAITLEPAYAEAYFSRGFAYQRKGEWDKAIADYTAAIELKPKDAAAYSYRGNAQKGKGEYALALKDYATAMEVDPKYSLVYYDLANLQAMTGKREEALRNFEKYLAMQPTADDHMIAWALYSIACIHSLEGRVNEALDLLSKALESGLDNLGHIQEDTDLNPIRDQARFTELIRKYFSLLPLDQMSRMLIRLMAGEDVEVHTDAEKNTKKSLLKDIAFAKEHGYQIQIPNDM